MWTAAPGYPVERSSTVFFVTADKLFGSGCVERVLLPAAAPQTSGQECPLPTSNLAPPVPRTLASPSPEPDTSRYPGVINPQTRAPKRSQPENSRVQQFFSLLQW